MIWGSRPRAGDRRWPRAGLVAASTAALLSAACSSGEVESAIEAPLPDYIRPCADQYVEGELISYEDGTFSDACRDDAGELIVPVPVQLDCTDGPDLVYNEFAWGYEGDTMQLFPPDVEDRRPDRELILECLNRVEGEGGGPAE